VQAHYERPTANSGPYKERVIVFVHGIFGDADGTWRYSPSVYWPRLLLNDAAYRDSDIYIASYSTPYFGNTMNVEEIVANLNNRLVNDGVFSQHREVVFVCHSLGGLVIQRLLLTFREYAQQVPLIYFFSTPETGAQIASLGAVFSSDPLLKAMFPGDENGYLQNLENEWRAAQFHIHRYCAFEKKKYRGVLVVDRLSGTRNCDEPAIAINEDHLSIVKPSGMEHDSYIALRNAVRANPILLRGRISSGAHTPGPYSPPPIEKTLRFSVMVPFDTDPDSMPIPLDENPDDPLFRTYVELQGLASYGTIPDLARNTRETDQITWKAKSISQADAPEFFGSLLQYYILQSIDNLQKDTLTIAVGYPPSARAGIRPPDAIPYRDGDLFRQLADNPFFQPFKYGTSGDAMAWKLKPISMPKGTRIKLIEGGEKPKKYIVRLERPGYFLIEYLVESPFGTGIGSLPNNFTTSKSATTMQWAFFVTVQYSIQHRTDDHFNPDSYSAWADALYTALRSRLSIDEANSLGTTNQPRSLPNALIGSGKQQPPPAVTEPNTSVGGTTDKPGTVEVLPPTNADVKVTLKQAPTQTVTAIVNHPPTQIQNAQSSNSTPQTFGDRVVQRNKNSPPGDRERLANAFSEFSENLDQGSALMYKGFTEASAIGAERAEIAKNWQTHITKLRGFASAAKDYGKANMALRTKWNYYPEQTQYVFGDNPDNLGWGKLVNAFDSYAYHLETWGIIQNKDDQRMLNMLAEDRNQFEKMLNEYASFYQGCKARLEEMKASIQ
jgi:pimeloyl-ACP methyl ester carboxylesterase